MAGYAKNVQFPGPAGIIDCVFDWPEGTPEGWALVLHPHPLFAGTRDNKVVTTLARAFVQCGLVAVRPNFRGVGASEGEHDNAIGEADDMVWLVDRIRADYPDLAQGRFALGGFSFGSAVASQVWARRGPDSEARLPIAPLVMVGTAASRFKVAEVPADTLVIHGEQDETVPLAAVMDWARPQSVPVVVVPGADHFFGGKLPVIKQLVLAHPHLAGLIGKH